MIFTRSGRPVEIIAAQQRTVRSLMTGSLHNKVWHARVRDLDGQPVFGGEAIDAACYLRGSGGLTEIEMACASAAEKEKRLTNA